MADATQAVIRETVKHDGYPDSHQPMHGRNDERYCEGCEEARYRRNRNTRAAKTIGIHPVKDEAAGACKGCKASVFPGASGEAPLWAWNFDVDRAQWGIEERRTGHPKTLCPRCRPRE